MSDNSGKDRNLETKIIETWSTLDYRAERWGIEKIPDEMFQNHLPSDSGGTHVWTFLKIDGEWVDLENLDADKGYSPEEICFADDGTGFDYIYTALCHSSKKERETQTGKFGEGIKMYSAAALRNGVDISIQSQNWNARPYAKWLYLPQEGRNVSVLCQEITEGLEEIKGSRTYLFNPHPDIVKRVLSFKQRIFMYRRDLPPRKIEGEYNGHQLFQPEKDQPGELFVKEFKYDLKQTLFLTYKINGRDADSLLTPDRDNVKEHELRWILEKIICNFEQKELIKPLLDDKTAKYFEKNLHFINNNKTKQPHLWMEVFYDLYGENAVLASVHANVNSNVRNRGLRTIELPDGLSRLLQNSGVKKADEILNYQPKYELVGYDDLTNSERYVVDCFSKADKLMIDGEPKPAEIRVFSRAYDEKGDVTWFKGMTYFHTNPPIIYIKRSELSSLTTYAHERAHVETGMVDETKEFEEGLTTQLGLALDWIFRLRSSTR